MRSFFVLCSAFALMLSGCSSDGNSYTPRYGRHAEVGTPTQVQEAINAGSREIVLTNPLTGDATFSIPNRYGSGTELKLAIPAGGQNVRIIQNAAYSRAFPALNLAVEDAGNLWIDTPAMSVDVDGTVTGSLTAATAPSTLSILPDALINELIVIQGNVRLFGTVTQPLTDIAPSSKVLWPVATQDELRTQLAKAYDHIANGGVVLTADIEGSFDVIGSAQETQDVFRIGDAYTYGESAYDGYIFDGNGYSISGSAWNNVFAIYADDVIIRDLTVKQTADQKAVLKSDNTAANNNGISIYRSTGASLINVTVLDCGKAGMVINSGEAAAANLTMSGNAWGGVNVSKGGAPSGGPKPVFILSSGVFTGQSNPVYVSLDKTGTDYMVAVPAGWTDTTANDVRTYSPPTP